MKQEQDKIVKCVVWDLDNTIWDGVLLEGSSVVLKSGIREIISSLDSRGILQSISSRNEYKSAIYKLREFNLEEHLLYPQINWNSKAHSIKNIAEKLNISIDSIAFIDDQQYELDEVKYELPEVTCICAEDISGMLNMPEMNPSYISDDSRRRREMLITDNKRKNDEQEFVGPKEDFLKSLKMKLSIYEADKYDLNRMFELTHRTNQFNATGYTYSLDQLKNFILSPNFRLLSAKLNDKYGDYGNIGLCLMEKVIDSWTIKLLIISCRVLSRGIGSILLSYAINMAFEEGKHLFAEFLPNNKNRMMNITFKFMNFIEHDNNGEVLILKHKMDKKYKYPEYVQVTHSNPV